jgi:hypothetical protein
MLYTGWRPQDAFGIDRKKFVNALENNKAYTPAEKKTKVTRAMTFSDEVRDALLAYAKPNDENS